MARRKAETPHQVKQKKRPAINPENREAQLINYAMDLVEERLLNGTASSQETVHFLKLGSMKAKLEMEQLRADNELKKARTKEIERNDEYKQLVEDALKAMRGYTGSGDPDDYSDLY